jgi:hypothetical protein
VHGSSRYRRTRSFSGGWAGKLTTLVCRMGFILERTERFRLLVVGSGKRVRECPALLWHIIVAGRPGDLDPLPQHHWFRFSFRLPRWFSLRQARKTRNKAAGAADRRWGSPCFNGLANRWAGLHDAQCFGSDGTNERTTFRGA